MTDSDGTVAFSEERESPLKMTGGTAAAGRGPGAIFLPLKAWTMREATTQYYCHLLVFSGCPLGPQDSDWHFLPRYENLAQAAAIAIFLRGDENVIWVSSLSGEEGGGRKVLEVQRNDLAEVEQTWLSHVTLYEAPIVVCRLHCSTLDSATTAATSLCKSDLPLLERASSRTKWPPNHPHPKCKSA